MPSTCFPSQILPSDPTAAVVGSILLLSGQQLWIRARGLWSRIGHSSEQMLCLKVHVASVCFKCFRCFICMLQLFHVDVAEVDRDVAYIEMVVHVCCKLLSPMFHLCFRMHFAIVFIWMLRMFHTYIACILFRCCVWLQWFSCVFQVCFSSVS
jgi:hypothetical protein